MLDIQKQIFYWYVIIVYITSCSRGDYVSVCPIYTFLFILCIYNNTSECRVHFLIEKTCFFIHWEVCDADMVAHKVVMFFVSFCVCVCVKSWGIDLRAQRSIGVIIFSLLFAEAAGVHIKVLPLFPGAAAQHQRGLYTFLCVRVLYCIYRLGIDPDFYNTFHNISSTVLNRASTAYIQQQQPKELKGFSIFFISFRCCCLFLIVFL